MIAGEENKPSLDELAHYGVKGMKWRVHKDSRIRPSNWMTAKPGSETEARIIRESKAQEKVIKAKTVTAYNKALEEQAAIQIKNRQKRIKFGEAKTRDLLAKHRATKYKDMVSDQ